MLPEQTKIFITGLGFLNHNDFMLNKPRFPWCYFRVGWPGFYTFQHPMVFCFQNCSDLLREKIVLVIAKNF